MRTRYQHWQEKSNIPRKGGWPMHHPPHDIQVTQEPDLLFGFPVLFFGTLAVAGLVAYGLHRRWGDLPKVGQPRYDTIVLLLGLWCLGGLLTDAFAHISGVVDDTFFTPWHAIWYSGATAYGLYITYAILPEGGVRELVRHPFKVLIDVAPQHKPGVYGIVIFGISGVGDMIWHETLGVESNTDILLSPTHIGLFIGLIMSVTAPIWSAWPDAKSGTSGLTSQLLLVFGAGAAWSVIQLIFRYTNLWFRGLSEFCYSGSTDFCEYEHYNQGLEVGLQSFWLQALLLSGVLILFLRRWKPARGSMFILFMIQAISMWVYSEFSSIVFQMSLLLALAAELFLPVFHRWGMKVYVPLMAAAQVVIFMGMWWLEAQRISNVSYWFEGSELHVLPFGWTIHATFGTVVLAAAIAWFAVVVAEGPTPPVLSEDIHPDKV